MLCSLNQANASISFSSLLVLFTRFPIHEETINLRSGPNEFCGHADITELKNHFDRINGFNRQYSRNHAKGKRWQKINNSKAMAHGVNVLMHHRKTFDQINIRIYYTRLATANKKLVREPYTFANESGRVKPILWLQIRFSSIYVLKFLLQQIGKTEFTHSFSACFTVVHDIIIIIRYRSFLIPFAFSQKECFALCNKMH